MILKCQNFKIIDFAFISEWSDLSDWTKFAKINKIKTFKDI